MHVTTNGSIKDLYLLTDSRGESVFLLGRGVGGGTTFSKMAVCVQGS